MRSWLTYIFLLMVACGTVLTSCSDVLSEESLGTCDDRTTVRLTISFGGDDDPMSRDVGSTPAPKDDDLDYTTEPQAKIVDGDIFALVVTEDNKLVEYIDDLHIDESIHGNEGNQSPIVENYIYTWTLKGTMKPTSGSNKVKIVLLANLKENGIDDPDAYFKRLQVGTNLKEVVYKSLIYSYNGNTWSLSDNRIPMWGETAATTVPASSNANLPCYLYRAMAKVQIWVDKKNGLPGEDGELGTNDDFKITKITVQNANNQGYCVSLLTPNTTETVQYTAPSIPGYTSQNVVYSTFTDDQATKAFSDMIYLPEQSNTATGSTPVKLLVEYTYNGVSYTGNKAGVIEFKDSSGQAFDVVRNHSYIFNINIVEEQTGKLYYYVDWEEEEVNIEFN